MAKTEARKNGFFDLTKAFGDFRIPGFDVEALVSAGQLVLYEERESLLAGGKRFDPYFLLSSHQTFIAQALREGWQAVRISIDMTWLTKDVASPEQILKYEAAADAVFTFQNAPIIALMHYDHSKLLPSLVVEMLKLHHLFSNRSVAIKLATMTIVGAICMVLVAATVLLVARSQLVTERTEKAHAIVDAVWQMADGFQRAAASGGSAPLLLVAIRLAVHQATASLHR